MSATACPLPELIEKEYPTPSSGRYDMFVSPPFTPPSCPVHTHALSSSR